MFLVLKLIIQVNRKEENGTVDVIHSRFKNISSFLFAMRENLCSYEDCRIVKKRYTSYIEGKEMSIGKALVSHHLFCYVSQHLLVSKF